MNILNFLSDLVYEVPNSKRINEIIKQQPEVLQNTFEHNDMDALRALLSSNKSFANETKVTTF